MSALPDEYQNASLVNGLPTAVFASRPYHRNITNIVVGSSVAASVKCYRGSLTSVPVAQNAVGSNTVSGKIPLPAGQVFYVQWSAAGSPVSSAFARVSADRVDDPLGDDSSSTQIWAIDAITSITIGIAPGPRVVIGVSPIPAELVAYYAAGAQNAFTPPETVIEADIYYDGQTPENYIYRAIVIDSSTPTKILSAAVGHFYAGAVRENTRTLIDPSNQTDNTFFTGNKITLQDKTGDAVGTVLLGAAHYTDVNADRLQLLSDGVIALGPGGTNQPIDTKIFRDDVRSLTTGYLRGPDPASSFGGDDWHEPTLGGTWSNFGGVYPKVKYRMVAAPYKCVQLIGVANTGGTPGGSPFTLPVGYRPSTKTMRVGVVNSGAGACIDVPTSGVITPLSLTASSVCAFDCIIPLDPAS